MWKLPDSVDIGPITYITRYEPRLADEGLMGRILFLESIIEIRPGMSDQLEELTLVHERLHGALFHAGIREHDEPTLDVIAGEVIRILRAVKQWQVGEVLTT